MAALCLSWVAILLVLGLRWNVIRIADRDWRIAQEQLDATDPGWRWVDIDTARPSIPNDQNAALVVMKVRSLMPSNWYPKAHFDDAPDENLRPFRPGVGEEIEALPMPDEVSEGHFEDLLFFRAAPNQRVRDRWLKELRSHLDNLRPALDEAKKLENRPQGRYPLTLAPNFLSTMTPSEESRPVVTLLRFEAASLAHMGRTTESLQCVKMMMNANRATGDEPLVYSQLRRTALNLMCASQLEQTLGHGAVADQQLESIQRLFETEEAVPRLHIGMRGERAGYVEGLNNVVDRNISPAQLLGGPPTISHVVDEEIAIVRCRQARVEYVRKMTDDMATFRKPPVVWIGTVPSGIMFCTNGMDLVEAMTTFNSRFAVAELRCQAVLRCAIVGIAAERFRLKRGRWPTSLDELVTANLLLSVPADPFDGKPLRFAATAQGCVVYSTGQDLVDDGGVMDAKLHQQRKGDHGFRLFDPAHRSIPARR